MSRALGIDVGTKTLGVAVGDEGGTVAFPVTTIRRRGMRRDIDAVMEIAEDRSAEHVVVGLPLEMNGEPGAMAAEADAVADALASRGLVVHRQDERLSTVAAERALLEGDVSRKKRKKVVDKVAATLILQAWLDARAGAR
jgi:putative Holliday junction resolvase